MKREQESILLMGRQCLFRCIQQWSSSCRSYSVPFRQQKWWDCYYSRKKRFWQASPATLAELGKINIPQSPSRRLLYIRELSKAAIKKTSEKYSAKSSIEDRSCAVYIRWFALEQHDAAMRGVPSITMRFFFTASSTVYKSEQTLSIK